MTCMTAESTTSSQEDRMPWAAMAGIIATVTVFALAQGLTYPLLSFILERQGTTPGLIGLSAAMTPLGFIVSAPFIPALVRRVGGARLAILCPASLAGCLLLPLIFNSWLIWPLVFVWGGLVRDRHHVADPTRRAFHRSSLDRR
jgi:MFS family permease